MKKVILFFALSLMLSACNGSENESNANEDDPILGTWSLASKTFHNPTTDIDTPIVLKPCELETAYTFKAEGAKFTGAESTYHTTTSACSTENLMGRWGHEDDNYYMLYNNNTISLAWTEVVISGSTLTTKVVNGDGSHYIYTLDKTIILFTSLY
ncbi:hypothetical protein [Flavobacterium sp. 3HN19-14]|uniref:hypothetical protein n=1 Tax=Flavobacterium sp. 3HN19-14 TaxID=3448133 RepID=UPI003EE0C2F1